MDDRTAHFFASVARLCADANLGGITVRLTVEDGDQVIGVPDKPLATEGLDQLGDTGYADALTLDGVAVALSDIKEATLHHPRPPSRRRPPASTL